MPAPAVAVNASVVGRDPTGLGLYAINLVRHLDRIRPDLAIYTSSPDSFGHVRGQVHRITALVRPEHGLRGHAARLVWTQLALRARTRYARALLNTVPEGPLGSAPAQVTVVHDLLPLAFPDEYPRQQHYFRHLVPRVLRRSRVVVADSENTRQEVIRRYGLPAGHVHVVYPGFEPGGFHGQRRAADGVGLGPPYLLYVGNLLPHKNLLRLVDAVALVRRRRPCRLVIRGTGRAAYARALRARIETLGLSDAVSFAAYADVDGLRELYAGATCLVLPSLAEGFGLPVLEAMASGTPVITSSVSSLPEVAGGAALTVDPYDPTALAEAICTVMTEPELRAELRQRGFERARQFSWERTAAEISRLLDRVLAGPAEA